MWFLTFINVVYYIDCIWWTILLNLGFTTCDGVWFFLCVVGFGLLISWEFWCVNSSEILACNFLFWWYLCMVLVSGWWWLPRMCLEVFPPIQSFGRVWENSKVSQFFVCLAEVLLHWKRTEKVSDRDTDIRRGDRECPFLIVLSRPYVFLSEPLPQHTS